jgi:hypothetical protein
LFTSIAHAPIFILFVVAVAVFYFTSQGFLNTFDAVVCGDGSFQFVRSVVDSVLQLPPSTGNNGNNGFGGARGLFRRPFGLFSSGGGGIGGAVTGNNGVASGGSSSSGSGGGGMPQF